MRAHTFHAENEHGRSDAQLLDACREGDDNAFAILWSKHRRAGIVAARGLAPTLDSEDLVANAFLKIFELCKAGKGPKGLFRPYLYRVLQTLAADFFRSNTSTQTLHEGVPAEFRDAPWDDTTFDKQAISKAFATLEPRWQEALWYSVVEGMPPRQIAGLMGITPNAVSSLVKRARDGLRVAFLEAQTEHPTRSPECQRTRGLLDTANDRLSSAELRLLQEHLASCPSCGQISHEWSRILAQLPLCLAWIFLGGTATTFLPNLTTGTSTSAASPAANNLFHGATVTGLPAVQPPAFETSSTIASAASTFGAVGSATSVGTLVPLSLTVVTTVSVALFGAGIWFGLFPEQAPPARADGPQISQEYAPSTAPPPERDGNDRPDPDEALPAKHNEPSDKEPVRRPGDHTPASPQTPAPQDAPLTPSTPPDSSGQDPDDGDGDGDDGTDLFDPSLSAGFSCYFQQDGPESLNLSGTATEYGVLYARITQGTTTVDVVPSGYESVTDSEGNTFTNIFTGTDPSAGNWWWSQSLTPLTQWGLTDAPIDQVVIELKMLTPDGRYSNWVQVVPETACS